MRLKIVRMIRVRARIAYRVSFLTLEFIFNDCKADIILVNNSTGK